MLTVGSLFAGVGGFDEAFRRQGFTARWAVEIDPDARRVLAARFPEAELHEDVRECGKANLARVDVVCGGFPCQDLSVAGRRAGLEGARSGLFYEMVRITDELRPQYLLWENVPGLLSSEAEEYASERCVCGWDFGWGRLPDGWLEQEVADLRCAGPGGHDSESPERPGAASRRVRGNASPAPRANGEVGSGMDLGGKRESRRRASRRGATSPVPEGAAGKTPARTGRDEARRPEFLDGSDEAEGRGDSGHRSGAEPERAFTASPTVSSDWGCVCPGCGRFSDATEAPRPVRRSGMGAVVRTLARIGYFGAWRILDSRWFGVPQRRRRVFGLFARGRAGALRCAEVLALGQGGGGHPAQGREAGARVAAAAEGSASLTGGGADSPQSERIWSEGGARPALDTGRAVPNVLACPLPVMTQDNGSDVQVTRTPHRRCGVHAALFQATGAGAFRAGDPSLSAGDDNGSNQVVTHAHQGVGHDASEDGTGRGTPLVAIPMQDGTKWSGQNGTGDARAGDPAYTLDAMSEQAMAFSHTQGLDAQPSASARPTLRKEGGGQAVAVLKAWNLNDEDKAGISLGDMPGSLQSSGDMPNQFQAVHTGMTVRRLTPVECCRLMSLPDDWLDLDPPLSDSAKYRLLGNSVVVNVVEWIARRLAALENPTC